MNLRDEYATTIKNDDLRAYIRRLEEELGTDEQTEMRKDYDRRMSKIEAELYTRKLKEKYQGGGYSRVEGENYWFPKEETSQTSQTVTSTYKVDENTVPNMVAMVDGEEYQVDIKYDNPKDDPTYEFCEKVKKIGKHNIMKEFMKKVLDKFKKGSRTILYYCESCLVNFLIFIGIYEETKEGNIK